MYKFNDLAGKVFGRLTVLEQFGRTNDRHILWKCSCECGNEAIVSSHQLVSGKTKSCGCLCKENTSKANRKHGATGDHSNIDRLYRIWSSIRKRCNTQTCKDFKNYGGRGICVCKEWDDFTKFRDWTLKNGYSYTAAFGKCTIDRIDVNGNYEPNNCRWVGMDIQQRNKRNSKARMDGGADNG